MERATRKRLQEIGESVLGSGVSIAWSRVAVGVSTIVYRAQRGDERFYLRVLPEPSLTFAPEVRTHGLARQLGCSVPEVLAYEPCDRFFQRSIMLTTEIPGTPISHDVKTREIVNILRAAGQDLASINTIPVNGFGWISRCSDAVDDQLTAEFTTVEALLDAEYLPPINSLSRMDLPRIPPSMLHRGLHTALNAVRSSGPSVLVHGDFDTSHIFAAHDRYSGIIDFGEIRGMPFEYDLGHHLMHDCERLPYSTFDSLIEGYSDICPLPEENLCKIRAWSALIAARALWRGLQRNPESEIVTIARRSLLRAFATC